MISNMDRLVTVSDVAKRYGCSRQTARKYIRQCDPHMEKPLVTTLWAFNEWEMNRMATKVTGKAEMPPHRMFHTERVIVPRRR